MIKPKNSDQSTQTHISYRKCPAKTYPRDGQVYPGRKVPNHCLIVGKVAEELIRRYPEELGKKLFPEGAALTASTHDIGKVSPYFYEKLRQACTAGTHNLPELQGINPELEKSWGGHAGVSQLTARALKAPNYVPEIIGQHHGFSPPVAGKRADDEIFGGEIWQKEREALVHELKEVLNTNWPHVKSVAEARLLAGLTSVADWIGSGECFEDPEKPWQDQIGPAIDKAGIIPPRYKAELSFQDIFGFEPYPVQQTLISQVQTAGVYVMEAPMGQGKTEAALYAAYRILSRNQATGIYFALPTQLTSNKLYERFKSFLSRIMAEDCPHRPLLLHATAWLQDTEMGEEGSPGGAWFNQAKRGLLAPFAVGTLDQALMAAMNVKHGFVRAFGLAGKVVILDEIHTYDAYTGTLLDTLVNLLQELHCTVIILSATLCRERRQQLLGQPVVSEGYPLITAIPQHQKVQELPVKPHNQQKVTICLLNQVDIAIQEAIDRACSGQQVLWIENTVAEAQERYLDLAARAAELNVACGLLHSRFTFADRSRIEAEWVNLFGKTGWNQRLQQGRILIGTQVLEQSLDIDADFLVTRFAPSDMLLQRLGRLWRQNTPTMPCRRAIAAWIAGY